MSSASLVEVLLVHLVLETVWVLTTWRRPPGTWLWNTSSCLFACTEPSAPERALESTTCNGDNFNSLAKVTHHKVNRVWAGVGEYKFHCKGNTRNGKLFYLRNCKSYYYIVCHIRYSCFLLKLNTTLISKQKTINRKTVNMNYDIVCVAEIKVILITGCMKFNRTLFLFDVYAFLFTPFKPVQFFSPGKPR